MNSLINRRKFMGASLASIAMFLTASVTDILKPKVKKRETPTMWLDRKQIKSGLTGFALVNGDGELIRQVDFKPIYMNTGDTIELKYNARVF